MSATAGRLALGLAAFVLIGWGAGELWLAVVGSLDIDAVRDVAADRTTVWNSSVRLATWLGSLWVLAPLALICALALRRSGHPRCAWAVVLGLGGAALIATIVKALVARPRPPVAHLQKVSGFSFPSGHAIQAGAFWLALVLALRAAGTRPALVLLAAAVGAAVVAAVAASRVYLGVHYPGDVIAGIVLGAGWSAYVARCLPGEARR